MKNVAHNSLRIVPATLSLVFFLLANHAGAQQGWDPNGLTSIGGNGTWDATTPNWTPNGTQTQVASGSLVPWTSGDIALFCAGPSASTSQGGPWTVTVNGAITVGGMVNGLDNPGSCYITLANGTSGSLNLVGPATFSSAGTAQGANVINVPITGTGPLTLYGQWGTTLGVANSFTSGCNIDGTGGVSFGNNAAFGTGTITWQTTGFIQPADASAYTIANAMTHGALVETFGGSSGGVTFSGNWALPSTGTTTIENYNTGGYAITVAGVISGAAALTINSTTANFNNPWIFTKANTFSGALTIAAGTLRQGAANVIPSGSGKGTFAVALGATFDLGGFNCSVDGLGTSAGTIDNATGAGTPTLTIGNNNGGGTHSGVIKNTTGTLALAKVGTGQVSLTGVNTYSGITTISGGKLQINADSRLGAAPGSFVANQVTLNNGGIGVGLRVNGNTTFSANRGITVVGNGGSVEATTSVTAKYPGAITGAGNFASGGGYTAGYGTNLLSGANTYSGTTTIVAGILRLGASGTLPYGTPLTIGADNNTGGGAALDMSGFTQTIGPLASSTGFGGTGTDTPTIVLNGDLTVLQTNINTIFAGNIVGSGGNFIISGNAALTLSGVNTYSGATTISSGELLGATGGSCASSTVTVADGATNGVSVTDNTKQWTCGSVTYNSGAPALDFNFGYSVAPSTSVAPLNISGDVTFNATPTVTIEAGSFPAGTGTYPLMTWSGSQLGTAPVPTTVTLPPHVSGSLSVSGNTLYLNVTASTQPLRWTGATDSNWDINVPADLNWDNSTPSSTYYQETTLPGDAVIFDETYIHASQNIALNTIVTPASVTVSNSAYNYTIGGTGGIAGSTSLTKMGSGTLTLNFANTYTGGTTIAGGTLSIGTDFDLGAVPSSTTPASIVLSNAALSANTTLTLNANRGITMQADSTLDVASSQTLTYTGIIAGPSWNLTKTGPGTLVLGGNHNSYSGNTIISAGILQTGGDHTTAGTASNLGAVPSSPTPNNITLAGGTLQGNNLNFAFMSYRGITLTADSGLSALTNCAMGIQGPIIGNYGLTISSPIGSFSTNGIVYLEGTNTYTGNTVISYGGILSLYYSGSISNSAAISIAAGAGFDVSNYTNDLGAKAFSLVSGQSLIASGTGTTTTIGSANAAVLNGPAAGTVSLNSQPITLNYAPTGFTGDATHPSLYVPQGTLVLNGNAFTVNNMAASPLGGGTYVLIQQANGNISSSGSYSVNVTGTGLAAGATASISVSGGSVNLVVVAPVVSRPGINSVTLSGANLIFSGTNGPDNGTFHVLSSTNVALPLSNWTSIASGTFSPTGAFSVTNAVGANPRQFFVIQIP